MLCNRQKEFINQPNHPQGVTLALSSDLSLQGAKWITRLLGHNGSCHKKLITSKLRWECRLVGYPFKLISPPARETLGPLPRNHLICPSFGIPNSRPVIIIQSSFPPHSLHFSVFSIPLYIGRIRSTFHLLSYLTLIYILLFLYEICLNLTCLNPLISLILLVYCEARESTYTTPDYFCFGKYWTPGPSHTRI